MNTIDNPFDGVLSIDAVNAYLREVRAQLADTEAKLSAANSDLDSVRYAAHMPDSYKHGLPSWINQQLYACYVGAKFSDHVLELINSGRVVFPDAPVYKRLAAAEEKAAAADHAATERACAAVCVLCRHGEIWLPALEDEKSGFWLHRHSNPNSHNGPMVCDATSIREAAAKAKDQP